MFTLTELQQLPDALISHTEVYGEIQGCHRAALNLAVVWGLILGHGAAHMDDPPPLTSSASRSSGS